MKIDVKLSANGRICIPADVREQLGLKDGDRLTLEVTDRGILLTTFRQRVRDVQAKFAPFKDRLPTVDQFIADKREQVQLDEARDREVYGE